MKGRPALPEKRTRCRRFPDSPKKRIAIARVDGVGAWIFTYKACGLVLSYYFYSIPSLERVLPLDFSTVPIDGEGLARERWARRRRVLVSYERDFARRDSRFPGFWIPRGENKEK